MPDIKSSIQQQEGTNPTVPTTGTQTSTSVTTGSSNTATAVSYTHLRAHET